MSEQHNILNEALRYAEHGLHVIPIKPGQKRPPMLEWQNHATTDPQLITHWWTQQYTNHGVGIAPRQLPNGQWLFILDIDEKPDASGSETLQELIDAYGPLPDTPTVHSGSGKGTHYYLTSPFEIRNDQAAKIGPGIDIRGNGGQTCAPPTIHETGNQYTWDLEYNLDTVAIAEAPGWLLHMLTPKQPAKAVRNENRGIWDELDTSPAGIYNQQNTWEQLLTADGWKLDRTDRTGEQHWIRPGKDRGTSATVGYKQLDILRVFTSSLTWLPEGTYSKFKYYAHSQHSGNMSDAAKTIRNNSTNPPMIAANPDEPWNDPIPLTTLHHTPTFPTHTLPNWALDHIKQTADNIQTPIDLPATLWLGALATIRLKKTFVTYPRQNWRQPTNLYCAVALPPSAGKSPVKNAIFKPIEQLELNAIQTNRKERLQAESKQAILEKKRKNLEDDIAKPKTKDQHTQQSNEHELFEIIDELANFYMPPTGQIFVDDTTTEALGEALRETNGGIAIISAEGGIFDRIAGLYNNDGKSNMDLYLEGWSGGTYKVNRIRREPIHIPSANITIACTVQPATLDQIGANTEMQGRGLIARFLLCEPDNNVGTRDRTAQHNINPQIEHTYTQNIHNIYNQPHLELTLTGTASDIYAQWDQHLENQLQPGQPLEHLSEWIGKLRATTIRIAALLHHAWHQTDDQLSPQTIQDAIDIANYYLAHAQKIADRWGSNPTIRAARTIHDWAQRNHHKTFSIRELYTANRRQFPTVDQTREPLQLLVERGWLKPLFDGPITIGRRGQESPRFATHPLIHNQTPVIHNPQPVDNLSHARHARTTSTSETDKPVDNYPHARHARTLACAPEENWTMESVPRGNIKDLSIFLEKNTHAHTDPCAHETQLPKSTINLDNLF